VDKKEIHVERKRINSSKLRAVGYDERTQSLEVEFTDGKIVVYANVSPEVHRGLMAAPSATSYFDDKIAEEFAGRRLR
jgi:KTSC domain